MRIELNPRPSDGHDTQERTGWSHDPLQLSHRLEITVRINGISIAAETDVFVFIANPDNDSVTRVNAASLEVRTSPVEVVNSTQEMVRRRSSPWM